MDGNPYPNSAGIFQWSDRLKASFHPSGGICPQMDANSRHSTNYKVIPQIIKSPRQNTFNVYLRSASTTQLLQKRMWSHIKALANLDVSKSLQHHPGCFTDDVLTAESFSLILFGKGYKTLRQNPVVRNSSSKIRTKCGEVPVQLSNPGQYTFHQALAATAIRRLYSPTICKATQRFNMLCEPHAEGLSP